MLFPIPKSKTVTSDFGEAGTKDGDSNSNEFGEEALQNFGEAASKILSMQEQQETTPTKVAFFTCQNRQIRFRVQMAKLELGFFADKHRKK